MRARQAAVSIVFLEREPRAKEEAMATQEIDRAAAEQFAERMVGVLNHAMLGLQMSVGHQVGLYELLSGLEPATAERIAREAGLDERYVREWLGGQVVGGIVEYDPAAKTYVLPLEHAASLTREAGPDNLAVLAPYIALCGEVEQDVVRSFREGGGVAYDRYSRFQELQAAESARGFDASLVDAQLPLVPGLVDRLRAGIDVLDVGCGQGHAVNLIADAFPASRVRGHDISARGVSAGRAEATKLGLANASFEVRDATDIEPQSFDLITAFDVIHDLAKPRETLTAIQRGLRPGGTFLMVDIAASSHLHENLEHPLGPALYGFSLFYCMTTSLATGGEGLGTMWGEQTALELLREAGFEQVTVERIEGDILNSYFVAAKP
jgi:2-polyprenyl-3-methyl-5-hydroxy-6-metoxy-1,4-benzoquinol methylase